MSDEHLQWNQTLPLQQAVFSITFWNIPWDLGQTDHWYNTLNNERRFQKSWMLNEILKICEKWEFLLNEKTKSVKHGWKIFVDSP